MPTLTPRWVLQYWGTEVCRRGFHDDIWIASLENKLRNSKDDIVISDCRFPNEIKSIKDAGGIVVRVARGPELPEGTWHERTVAWWAPWRNSAQAQTFTDTDWSFLLDTALLHNELWAGNPGVAGELRLRVAKFGASPEDRLRLKLEINNEAASAPVKPRVGADRKARLVAVVNA
jgi:hypothetical protein